jgi:thiol:disulfide interchange protein DsbC
MNFKSISVSVATGAALAILAAASLAQTPAQPVTTRAALASRDAAPPKPGTVEDRIRTLVRERLGQNAETVALTPFGLYEVIFGTEIWYVDKDVNYVMNGRVVDAKTRVDLTEQKRGELMRVDFKSLPLDQAIKQVRGSGKRVLVTFEDPNCGYCRQLARTLADVKDVTIYTFLLPILSQDSFEKSAAIWCAKDRAAAWNAYMLDGKMPTANGECKTPLQANLAMGQKLMVNGTPTLVFANGWRVPGAMQAEGLEQMFAQHGAGKK